MVQVTWDKRKSMIERVATSLATANLEPIRIAVALPEDVEEYGSAIGLDLDIEWVLDSNTYAGPIDAIEEALLDPECEDGLLQLATVDYPLGLFGDVSIPTREHMRRRFTDHAP